MNDESRATVLLIERDPDVSAMFTDILRDAGFQVEQLPENAEPVAFAEQMRPNVIALGVWPEPFLDAPIAADLQKNPETADIPVVVYSAFGRPVIANATASNIRAILDLSRKPISLPAAVARALGEPPSSTPSS